jgi:DNA polymerase III delta prime subunit
MLLSSPRSLCWTLVSNFRISESSSDKYHTELDSKIRELPHKGGWRFGDEKRCLPGTREDFLHHIVKWVENTNSKHALVLFGQAGTGKSSIAHEVARHFENKCLGSYFTFLRKEGSKHDAYQLFTTLARDLSDHHSTFKLALGRVVKDNSSLRSSRDYRTLFERLLLEPLRNLNEPLPGPVLIVIDALDESGDSIGRNGLHTFLAQRLVDLPSSLRILVTSRPEDGIERAFANATSFDTIYMDDIKLASSTEQDIRMYIQKELPPDVFRDHGLKLARAAEGIFQWATVACGFINSPESLGLTMKSRVERLLGHSRGRSGEGPLDSLYEEVLKQYCKTYEAQALFRTIMGQLLAAIEPLSINSLIALRRHSPVYDSEDSVVIVEILGHLGSLLSNVTSTDHTRPIIPLHTSFRDFLINGTSNVFYVDLGHAHHQLAHSCVGLMLNDLKFNICELESSYLANCDVPDLDSRMAKHIPPALSYACVFWANHLEHLGFLEDLLTKLESLFETKFLFWLEVLSLESSVAVGLRALSNLLKWLPQEVGIPHDSI